MHLPLPRILFLDACALYPAQTRELRGVVVIGDAAFAERRVAQRVLDKGGNTSSS